LKELGAQWLVKMVQYIEDNPQFVVNGFIKAGISRALDNGTADLSSDESSASNSEGSNDSKGNSDSEESDDYEKFSSEDSMASNSERFHNQQLGRENWFHC